MNRVSSVFKHHPLVVVVFIVNFFFYHLLTFDETKAHKTCRASKIKKLRGNWWFWSLSCNRKNWLGLSPSLLHRTCHPPTPIHTLANTQTTTTPTFTGWQRNSKCSFIRFYSKYFQLKSIVLIVVDACRWLHGVSAVFRRTQVRYWILLSIKHSTDFMRSVVCDHSPIQWKCKQYAIL